MTDNRPKVAAETVNSYISETVTASINLNGKSGAYDHVELEIGVGK